MQIFKWVPLRAEEQSTQQDNNIKQDESNPDDNGKQALQASPEISDGKLTPNGATTQPKQNGQASEQQLINGVNIIKEDSCSTNGSAILTGPISSNGNKENISHKIKDTPTTLMAVDKESQHIVGSMSSEPTKVIGKEETIKTISKQQEEPVFEEISTVQCEKEKEAIKVKDAAGETQIEVQKKMSEEAEGLSAEKRKLADIRQADEVTANDCEPPAKQSRIEEPKDDAVKAKEKESHQKGSVSEKKEEPHSDPGAVVGQSSEVDADKKDENPKEEDGEKKSENLAAS